MSTPDVESRLADLLHQRAEHTMSHTDTQAEVLRFRDDLEDEPPRRRGGMVVAAAAAAAAAAVIFWGGGPTDEGAEPAPVQQPVTGEAAADVAGKFLAAYAAGDVKVAAALVTGGREPWPDWRVDAQADQAWVVEYLWKDCRAVRNEAALTEVACPFDLNVMHSDQLGIEPFHGNKFTVMVEEDGDVLAAERVIPHEINGVGKHVEAVMRWAKANNPTDWRLIDSDAHLGSADQRARWMDAWKRSVDGYVAAHS